MVFHLLVTRGPDEGKTFRVERESLIGRAPSSDVLLNDPSVAWEHALVRSEDGKLFIQNLSAVGTMVEGRRISGEERLGHSDEIQLSETCRLTVQEKGGRAGPGPVALLVTLVLLGAALGGMYLALRPREPEPPPVSAVHWRTAYNRLEERLVEWEEAGAFPPEAITLFRDAWRMEIAYNSRAASEKWEVLRSLLLTMPLPDRQEGGPTMAEAASTSDRALKVIMGWDPDTSISTDRQWRSDEAYADALVWFVRLRAERSREATEKAR